MAGAQERQVRYKSGSQGHVIGMELVTVMRQETERGQEPWS